MQVSKKSKILLSLAGILVIILIGFGVWGVETGRIGSQALTSTSNKFYAHFTKNSACGTANIALWRQPDGGSWSKLTSVSKSTSPAVFANLYDASSYKTLASKASNFCSSFVSWRGASVKVGVCGSDAEGYGGHINAGQTAAQLSSFININPWGQLVKFHAVNVAKDGTHNPMTGVTAKCNPSAGTVSGAATNSSGQGYVYCLVGVTGITATISGGGTFDGGNSKSISITGKCAATTTQEFVRRQ